jgi:hypothetical protein
MSGLHDYYCIHGLENFLAVEQLMKVGQKLKESIISALPSNFVYGLSHQAMLSSSNNTSLLTINNVLNFNNAIATLRKSNEPGFLDKQIKRVLTSIDKNDSTLHASAENIKAYVDSNNSKAIDNCGVPVPTAMRKNVFAVDVKSLRVLNMKLLKSMCSNSALSTNSLSTKAEAELWTSNSLLNSRYGITERVAIEGTPILLECNTLQSTGISHIGNTEYTSTMMNVMNRALEITSSCVDPTMSSNLLIEIPRTKTSHCAYNCISHLT